MREVWSDGRWYGSVCLTVFVWYAYVHVQCVCRHTYSGVGPLLARQDLGKRRITYIHDIFLPEVREFITRQTLQPELNTIKNTTQRVHGRRVRHPKATLPRRPPGGPPLAAVGLLLRYEVRRGPGFENRN